MRMSGGLMQYNDILSPGSEKCQPLKTKRRGQQACPSLTAASSDGLLPISAHLRGKWEGEKGKILLSRRGDKATNPAAAIKGEQSVSDSLRIAEFNFNAIKEEN